MAWKLPLMFRRRFPCLIRRGDFLKDKELTRKTVKRANAVWVEREMKTNALLRFSPDGAPALLEILGSELLLLLCWENQSSARRVSLTELSDSQFAKNP
jgi:hypothetical protein